ncbi:MAG: hypothetical protein J0H39_20255 [Alphaproteobacteria bacterium]|nr:hypothetical protein [Alphaproteobacteria bacterium]
MRHSFPAFLIVAFFAAFPAFADGITRMGPTIDVQGIVEGDVALAGGTLYVEAEIAGDLVLAGGAIGVGAATKVSRNAYIFGHTLSIAGDYAQRVWLTGDAVVADIATRGDVKIAASGPVRLGPHTKIGGTLTIWSPEPPIVDGTAQIAGGIVHNPGSIADALEALMGFVGRILHWVFWFAIGFVALGLALLAPGFTHACASTIRAQPFAALAWGIGLGVGVPFAALLAGFTLVGLPLAATLILMLICAAGLGFLISSAALGGLIASGPGRLRLLLALAIGLAALLASSHIPMAGGWIIALAYLLGLGAFARETTRRMRAP